MHEKQSELVDLVRALIDALELRSLEAHLVRSASSRSWERKINA